MMNINEGNTMFSFTKTVFLEISCGLKNSCSMVESIRTTNVVLRERYNN
jgi:hypothetical protein